jgi:hypothetical protein
MNAETDCENTVSFQDFVGDYQEFNRLYESAKAAQETGSEFVFPAINPYLVDGTAYQQVGFGRAQMAYIYQFLDIDKQSGSLSLFSSLGGGKAGFALCTIEPIFPDGLDLDDYDCLDDLVESKIQCPYVDLVITAHEVKSMPKNCMAAIEFSFTFPQFVSTLCIEEELAKEEEDDTPLDYDDSQLGRTYRSIAKSDSDLYWKGAVDQKLDFKRTIRVFNPLSKKVKNWFKEGSLVVEVFGKKPNPNKIVNKAIKIEGKKKPAPAPAAASGPSVPIVPGAPAPVVQSTPVAAGGGEAALRAELAQAKAEAEKAKQELADLHRRYKVLEAAKPSGACSVM